MTGLGGGERIRWIFGLSQQGSSSVLFLSVPEEGSEDGAHTSLSSSLGSSPVQPTSLLQGSSSGCHIADHLSLHNHFGVFCFF